MCSNGQRQAANRNCSVCVLILFVFTLNARSEYKQRQLEEKTPKIERQKYHIYTLLWSCTETGIAVVHFLVTIANNYNKNWLKCIVKILISCWFVAKCNRFCRHVESSYGYLYGVLEKWKLCEAKLVVSSLLQVRSISFSFTK